MLYRSHSCSYGNCLCLSVSKSAQPLEVGRFFLARCTCAESQSTHRRNCHLALSDSESTAIYYENSNRPDDIDTVPFPSPALTVFLQLVLPEPVTHTSNSRQPSAVEPAEKGSSFFAKFGRFQPALVILLLAMGAALIMLVGFLGEAKPASSFSEAVQERVDRR